MTYQLMQTLLPIFTPSNLAPPPSSAFGQVECVIMVDSNLTPVSSPIESDSRPIMAMAPIFARRPSRKVRPTKSAAKPI